MSLIVDGTTGVTFNDSSLQGAAASPFGLKNRIINGDMRISQRGSVNVAPGGSYTYTASDRFSIGNYFGSGQIDTALSTSVVPNGYKSSLGLTVSTAPPLSGSNGYYVDLAQTIEGYNICDSYNQTVTLSFWVRSSVTGTYSVAFYNSDNTGVSSTTRYYLANYTISSANTWEQKTITVNLSTGTSSGTWNTTNGVGLTIAWQLGAESNRKGDTYLNTWGTIGSTFNFASASQTNWASTSGATFYITGVQLEQNTSATPFERRLYNQELANCQRYYYRTTPGTIGLRFGWGQVYATTGAIIENQFPVPMRIAPTALEQNGTAGNYGTLNSTGSGVTCSAVPAFNVSSTIIAETIFTVASGLTAGNATVALPLGATAYLGWSAEL